MRNKIKLLMLVLILALVLSACGQQAEAQLSGTVTLVWPDGTAQVWYDVPAAEGATASQALLQLLQAEKMAYTYSNGMWDGFNGVMSTMEDGWLFYVDGTLADVGADSVVLADGFNFSFEYVNYAAALGW